VKEDQYVEALREQAARFESEGVATAAEVEEIRRWEGQAAAVSAQHPAPKKFTPVSHTAGARPLNTFAVLALIFGLLGGVLGIVFGVIALGQIGRSNQSGFGIALAGIVLGSIATLLGAVALVILPAAIG
jgi:hypothetical protein